VKTRVKLLSYLFLLTALCVFAISCERDKEAVRQPFSSETWRRSKGEGRRSMVPSLLDSKILIGMKRGEVLQILGPPDKEKRCETFALVDRARIAVYYDNKLFVIDVRAMALPSKGTFDERQFDKIAWQAGDKKSMLAMARDLSTSRLLVGKKRNEVDQLLCTPIITTHAAIYYLGTKGIIGASRIALWVFFDENEVVEKAVRY